MNAHNPFYKIPDLNSQQRNENLIISPDKIVEKKPIINKSPFNPQVYPTPDNNVNMIPNNAMNNMIPPRMDYQSNMNNPNNYQTNIVPNNRNSFNSQNPVLIPMQIQNANVFPNPQYQQNNPNPNYAPNQFQNMNPPNMQYQVIPNQQNPYNQPPQMIYQQNPMNAPPNYQYYPNQTPGYY